MIRTGLDEVKRVAHAHGGTVNDVLLAATEGGLRELLRSRGEPTEDTTVRVYVPISMRHGGDGPQQGNQIAQMALPMPLGAADPGERLGGSRSRRPPGRPGPARRWRSCSAAGSRCG